MVIARGIVIITRTVGVYRFFVVTSDTLLLLSIAKKGWIGKQDKRRELKIAAAQNNDDNNIYRQSANVVV